jgi:hypothetical protein
VTIRRRVALTVVIVGACWIVGAVIQSYEFGKYFATTGRESIPLADTILSRLAFTLSPPLWWLFSGGEGIWRSSGGNAMIPRVVAQTAGQALIIYGALSWFRGTPPQSS